MTYYNDSLENYPNYDLDNENEEDEDNEEEKNEDNKEEKGVDEIIEVKKKDQKSIEQIENNISTQKEEKTDKKKEEEKNIKVNNKNDKNDDDKTSFCHIIFHKGEDIDISQRTIFQCYEEINNRNYLIFKKRIKIKILLLFEEQFLYFLKDRRIISIFDLNKLFDYKVEKKNKYYLFSLIFLRDDNLFERNTKELLFEENEGEKFEDYLIKILEKIEATFLEEIFDLNEEDEEDEKKEEEEENDDQEAEKKEEEIKNNENKIIEKKRNKKEENKIIKKQFNKFNIKGDDFSKLSSSREIWNK